MPVPPRTVHVFGPSGCVQRRQLWKRIRNATAWLQVWHVVRQPDRLKIWLLCGRSFVWASVARPSRLCAQRARNFFHRHIRCALFLSPTDALVDLKVWCRLGRFIPIWRNFDAIIHLHIAPVPQRWPASRGDALWLCIHPDVLQYLADVSTDPRQMLIQCQ